MKEQRQEEDARDDRGQGADSFTAALGGWFALTALRSRHLVEAALTGRVWATPATGCVRV